MMTLKRYRINRIAPFIATICTLAIASCSSANGPDGTSETPTPGTTFLQSITPLLGAGESRDTLKGFDTLLTTVAADNIFNVSPNSVLFIDSSYHLQTKIIERAFLFYPGGNIAIRHPAQIVQFFGDTTFTTSEVTVRDTFLVYPFGLKRNVGYTLLDTTVTANVGSKKQTTRHTVIDSIYFVGPEIVVLGNEPVSALRIRTRWLATSTATLDTLTRTVRRAIDYSAWYSPKLGYVVQDITINSLDSLGQGFVYRGGPGRTVFSYMKK